MVIEIFFGNTPSDSNLWDILYLKHIGWNFQGTCIMLVVRKTLCVSNPSTLTAVQPWLQVKSCFVTSLGDALPLNHLGKNLLRVKNREWFHYHIIVIVMWDLLCNALDEIQTSFFQIIWSYVCLSCLGQSPRLVHRVSRKQISLKVSKTLPILVRIVIWFWSMYMCFPLPL